MAFIDQEMPRRIAAGFRVRNRWKTTVIPMDNGGEQRNIDWLFSNMEATADFAAFTPQDQETLMNMMMACRGRGHAFRFFNPLDYTATSQPLASIGGVTRLVKAYPFGSETAYKLVMAPKTVTLSGAGTVDMDTGIVTGASLSDTWSGTFATWVRFDNDATEISAEAINAWKSGIELVEVRRWSA